LVLGQGNLGVTEVEVVPETSFANNVYNKNREVVLEQHHPVVVPQESSSLISGQKKQLLPSFSAKGGVVFFLHIPKTGGTSIRRNLETVERVHHIFGKNYSTYWDTAPLVEDAILHGTQNNNNTILFYEIHATDAPSFFKLRKRLRRWKDTAARNDVPVFFFTVVREPTSYAFSHFNFFHVQKRNPTFERCNATEENFLRKSLFNPQCQFLFKGEPSMRLQQAKQVYIKPEECEDVHGWMMDLFDWVGTMERLSNETLPLLARMFELPANFTFQKYKVAKDDNSTHVGEYFGMENVTSSALDSITTMSTLDTRLYESAKQNFPYSMWE
jgi:hypothetical protein